MIGKKFKNKTPIECAMESPAWTKGALCLLQSGLVHPSQYSKVLGTKCDWNWCLSDSTCLLLKCDFSKDRELANRVFFKILSSWCKYVKRENNAKNSSGKCSNSGSDKALATGSPHNAEGRLIRSVHSLFYYFVDVSEDRSKRSGFAMFWSKSFYYSYIRVLMEYAIKNVHSKDSLIEAYKVIGDLDYKEGRYGSSAEEYEKAANLVYKSDKKEYVKLLEKLCEFHKLNNNNIKYKSTQLKIEKAS